MPLPSYIQLANTFGQWVDATNNLISHLDNTSVYILVAQNATPRVSSGNVTINGVMTIANSTNSTAITPVGMTVGSTVVNTTATSLGGTLSVSGAANTLSTLGVTGTLTALGQLVVTTNANFDSGTLFVDSVNNRVGINNTAPNYALVVNGITSVKPVSEAATVSAISANGTINFDAVTQGVLIYTTNASANWTLNLRGNSTVALNTIMTTGDSMTFTFLVNQGATAYYASARQLDGSSVTPK